MWLMRASICFFASLFTDGCIAKFIIDSCTIELQENSKIKFEQESARQMKAMLQKHSAPNKIKENIEVGFRRVIQGASDSDEIRIVSITFEKKLLHYCQKGLKESLQALILLNLSSRLIQSILARLI